MSSSHLTITPIRSRTCFLRVKQRGVAVMTKGLGLQIHDTPERFFQENTSRVGFIVTKRLGNAVARNRAKRRLRAICQHILPKHAIPGYDYVIIGRFETATRDFSLLLEDLKYALKKTGGWRNPVNTPNPTPVE